MMLWLLQVMPGRANWLKKLLRAKCLQTDLHWKFCEIQRTIDWINGGAKEN